MSVIRNTQRPASILKNKSNCIFYYVVCESVVMSEPLTGHVGTNENCSELATKVLYGGKRNFHVSTFLYDIYDDL